MVLWLFATKFTSLSKIVIIEFNPFLMLLISYLIIGETVKKYDLITFALGMLGIVLLTNPFTYLKGVDDLIGIFLALLSSLVSNIGYIYFRKAGN